jgi:hypothetical protein
VSGPEFAGAYPEEWPAIAERVKAEASWRCVRCRHRDDPAWCRKLGVPRGTLPCDSECQHRSDGKKRVLTVHHLDGDKGNARWWNLLPLCQVCHLQIQAKVHPARTYLWPHSAWFRPYVAGYYALEVLGLDLDREEVGARMEELLRAGQPHLDDVFASPPPPLPGDRL